MTAVWEFDSEHDESKINEFGFVIANPTSGVSWEITAVYGNDIAYQEPAATVESIGAIIDALTAAGLTATLPTKGGSYQTYVLTDE